MNALLSPSKAASRSHGRAFTLIELLVVVGIIALLAGMLLPVLTRVRSKATGLVCANHVRQLQQSLLLYASENQEQLVVNLDTGRPYRSTSLNLNQNWVNNYLTWDLSPSNTNLNFLVYSPLAIYLDRGSEVFLCPSDRILSDAQKAAGWTRRVRSMSLNAMVGDAMGHRTNVYNPWNPGFRQYQTVSDVSNPSSIFTFLDENADSLGDGYFLNDLHTLQWSHLPASYHSGAGNLAFMDGHVETHPWVSSSTRRSARPNAGPFPFPVSPSASADFTWLAERMSERK
ncbi:MAG: type II secretion system protein [Verrucomicrobia bacterium]|nr:type II secretion system protein [Verrucomicrobiota bacterium]